MDVEVTLLKPTFKRYRASLSRSDLSVLRLLEYERLEKLNLKGLVLDIGGGSKIHYKDCITSWGKNFTYHSLNIDPNTEPTYLLKPDMPYPIEDNKYDVVISMNTLEHIFDTDQTLSELARVTKKNGNIIFTIPFMLRVHGHPDDYIRGTPSFWIKKLNEAGYQNVKVEALTWGPFSTGQSVGGLPGPFKIMRRHLAILLDIFYYFYRSRSKSVLVGAQDDPIFASPLGYYIEATKS